MVDESLPLPDSDEVNHDNSKHPVDCPRCQYLERSGSRTYAAEHANVSRWVERG